jgi:hypothetical protein
VSNAFFRYGDPRREAVSVRLLQYAAALLREQLGPVPALTWIPPGPGFDYADSPYLFGTRRGYGPLHIVWDTNLLIDYFQYGKAVWEFGEVPARANDELEAFQILTALWVVRDIRFHVLPRVIFDAKKQLSPERRAQRVNAIERFAAALQLVGTDPRARITRDGLLVLPESERIRALDRIPHLLDRNLIADTIALGAHVFLTNESKLLARSEDLRPLGLRIASPPDMLEALAQCGAFHCLFAPEYLVWPLPDQARVTELLDALAPDQQPEGASET